MRLKIKREFFAAFFVFLFFASQTYHFVLSANDASRVAGIQSLVEHGALFIDNSTFLFTVDKAFVNGHFYSDKSPIIIFFGSAIYFPIYHIFGLDFTDSNIVFYGPDNSTILLQPEKNFYPIESYGNNSYLKKFFDNATLVYDAKESKEINLRIPILGSSKPTKLQVFLNSKLVETFLVTDERKMNYLNMTVKLEKGRNVFELFTGECPIQRAFPCDLHLLASPKRYNAYFWVTLFTVGISSSVLIFFFYRSLKFFNLEDHFKDLLVFVLAAGSLIIPYTLTMTQHPLTALFLFLSFYYLLKLGLEKEEKRFAFLSGLFMGLAIVSEFYILPVALLFLVYSIFIGKKGFAYNLLIILSATILITLMLVFPDLFGTFSSFPTLSYLTIFIGGLATFIFLVWIRKINIHSFIFLVALCVPLSMYFLFNILTTGKIFPVFFYREFYHYKDSFWLNPTGWNKFDKPEFMEPKSIYAFNLFLGHHGIFLATPLLFFSFYSIFRILTNKKAKLQKEAVLVLSSFIVLSTLYVFHTSNYASASYAFRWFIPLTPILFFFLGFFVSENKSNKFAMVLFMIVLIISVYMALIGSRNPWKPIPETNNIIWKVWEHVFLKPIGLEYKPPY